MAEGAPRNPRGRPREYDPEEALDRATEAFWRGGFAATSLDDLSAATGMNRPSLYGAFGDKHALYVKTVERYIDDGRRKIEATLTANRPLREELMRVYDGALSSYFTDQGAARGCFLIGTAVTESMQDPEVREKLGAGLRDIDRLFEQRLKQAQAQGELAASADPVALAGVASAILHTLALRSRAGDSRAFLRATAEAGVQLICGSPASSSTKRARQLKR
jgi:AcrR family transcriptional regulator